MPYQVQVHQLSDLSHEESPNEIILDTHENTELHITQKLGRTIISLPYGNKFDLIDGNIIIHD